MCRLKMDGGGATTQRPQRFSALEMIQNIADDDSGDDQQESGSDYDDQNVVSTNESTDDNSSNDGDNQDADS